MASDSRHSYARTKRIAVSGSVLRKKKPPRTSPVLPLNFRFKPAVDVESGEYYRRDFLVKARFADWRIRERIFSRLSASFTTHNNALITVSLQQHLGRGGGVVVG